MLSAFTPAPASHDPLIQRIRVLDLRFPTSLHNIGSDAVNKQPDYSATYCVLETDGDLTGYGLTCVWQRSATWRANWRVAA